MKRVAAVCCVLVLAGCASSRRPDEPLVGSPPATGSADDDARIVQMQTSMTELLERLDVLNDRIARLEASIANAPRAAHLPAAQPELSPLAAAADSRAERVAALSEPPPAVATATSKALAGARIADIYRVALTLVGQGKLIDARRTFQQVFDADPTGDLADNALFWMGETYYAAGDYATAMRWYRRVTTEFGDQNKAPDALFKIALSYEKTGDLALAKQTLDEVIQKYPYSSPAASAKYELKRIKY